MILATINNKDKKLIQMHIKSYKEYLYNINEPQITPSYMSIATQYNIHNAIITKISIDNLISRYNNKDMECNICLEKKIIIGACTICTFKCCKEYLEKAVKICLENGN